jgi:hypothetical protein
MKKGKHRRWNCDEARNMDDIPDGMIRHLTSECDANVHDGHVVDDVTCESFEKGTFAVGPRMVKNAADLETDSISRQVIASAGGKKMLRPRGTIGRAEISRRGGLWPHITQSSRMILIRIILI